MKRSILVLFWVFMSATMFAQGGIDVAGIVLPILTDGLR